MAARRVFVGLYLLSGTTSLLYQVVWSRLLTLEMGHTAIAVSTVLAAFMGGQALGASLAGRQAPRLSPRRALLMYALLELAVCVAALSVNPLLTGTHALLALAYADGNGGPLFIAARLVLCLLIVTLPATAIGATFPIAVRWLEPAGLSPGRTAGKLYAANTLGAAAGAALAGFALLPTYGLIKTTTIGVVANVAIALGVLLVSRFGTEAEENEAAARRPADTLGTLLRDVEPSDDAASGTSSLTPTNPTTPTSPVPLDAAFDEVETVEPETRPTDRDDDDRREADDRRQADDRRRTRRSRRAPRQAVPRPRSAAVLMAISGCVALIYEVAWTRLLALTIGPTTYAFSAMLVAFVVGIAAGAALAARIVARVNRPIVPLAVTQLLAALGAFGAAWLVPRLPTWAAAAVSSSPDYVWLLLLDSAGIVLLLAPMTMALGAAFPFAVAAATMPGASIAGAAARIYTANTVGAIAGALAGGFLLIPNLGLQRTIVLAGAMATIAGVELVWRTRRRTFTRAWIAGLGTLAMVAGLTLPDWDRKALSGGPYRFAPPTADLQVGADAGDLLYYGDGAIGTVAVRQIAGEKTLSVNGKVEASDGRDMLTQKLLAHLPLLLHPAPRDICIIGLGSGVTTGAALTHPVDRVDTIELSAEVVEASALFATPNLGALRNPRGHLVIGDGRSHLRLARRTYDVIVSEPSTPWMAGVASLFTREFFVAARDRLSAGGLFCQWAQTHDITRQDLTSIVATFTDVFPDGSLWLVGEGDLLLIGGRTPVGPRLANLAANWSRPGVAADLARVDARSPFSLLSLFVAHGPALRALGAGAAVQTDDRTALEFSAPRGQYERTHALGTRARAGLRGGPMATAGAEANQARWLAQLGAQAASPPDVVATAEATAGAADWRDRAAMLARAGADDLAYDAAVRALSLDPADLDALDLLARATTALGRFSSATTFVQGLVERLPGSVAPLIELSRLQAAWGRPDEALGTATLATTRFVDSFAGWDQLATVAAEAGREPALAQAVGAMQLRFAGRWETRYHAARLHLLRGESTEAARLGESVLQARPADPRVLTVLGAAYANLGVHDRAREAFEAAIASDPRDPAGYVSLGRFELDTFNPQRAASLFNEALFLDPRSVPALNGLADALARMGRNDRAAELRARAGAL